MSSSSRYHESMNYPKIFYFYTSIVFFHILSSIYNLFESFFFRQVNVISILSYYHILQKEMILLKNSAYRITIIRACRMKKWITYVPGMTRTLCDQQLPRDSGLLQNRCNKKIPTELKTVSRSYMTVKLKKLSFPFCSSNLSKEFQGWFR